MLNPRQQADGWLLRCIDAGWCGRAAAPADAQAAWQPACSRPQTSNAQVGQGACRCQRRAASASTHLKQPVRQRALAVVDMGNDGEVANARWREVGHREAAPHKAARWVNRRVNACRRRRRRWYSCNRVGGKRLVCARKTMYRKMRCKGGRDDSSKDRGKDRRHETWKWRASSGGGTRSIQSGHCGQRAAFMFAFMCDELANGRRVSPFPRENKRTCVCLCCWRRLRCPAGAPYQLKGRNARCATEDRVSRSLRWALSDKLQCRPPGAPMGSPPSHYWRLMIGIVLNRLNCARQANARLAAARKWP